MQVLSSRIYEVLLLIRNVFMRTYTTTTDVHNNNEWHWHWTATLEIELNSLVSLFSFFLRLNLLHLLIPLLHTVLSICSMVDVVVRDNVRVSLCARESAFEFRSQEVRKQKKNVAPLIACKLYRFSIIYCNFAAVNKHKIE